IGVANTMRESTSTIVLISCLQEVWVFPHRVVSALSHCSSFFLRVFLRATASGAPRSFHDMARRVAHGRQPAPHRHVSFADPAITIVSGRLMLIDRSDRLEHRLPHRVGTRADQERTAVTASKAQEYRRLAQECRTMARSVSTEETRAALLEMAQTWLRLAE